MPHFHVRSQKCLPQWHLRKLWRRYLPLRIRFKFFLYTLQRCPLWFYPVDIATGISFGSNNGGHLVYKFSVTLYILIYVPGCGLSRGLLLTFMFKPSQTCLFSLTRVTSSSWSRPRILSWRSLLCCGKCFHPSKAGASK